MRRMILTIGCAMLVALVAFSLYAQQAGRGPQGGAAAQAGRGGAGRGLMNPVPQTNDEPVPRVPVGFTTIFNGRDLSGWHISKTNHHGTTPDFHVMPGGILVASQNPLAGGGVLLTDKKYKNVEVYIEVKPDFGCDSGLFLHTSEAGAAYQVMLDYLPGGNMGGVYGEALQGISTSPPGWNDLSPEARQAFTAKRTEAWQKAWKREQWNSVRARITGNPPHISTWINEEMMMDWTDSANHGPDGAEDGFIGLQVHGGARWRAGSFWRWRVVAVKELP
jgi:hypothetical protein